MAKYLIMMAAGAASMLALGAATAETITEKSGNSTLTVTQTPGTNMKRTVQKTKDGQTIVQESGGNSITSTQSTTDDECKDKTAAKKDGKKTASSDDDDDCD